MFPKEWAQTAAVGIALRNADFGLQFGAAGDVYDGPAVDELGGISWGGASSPMPPTVETSPPPLRRMNLRKRRWIGR